MSTQRSMSPKSGVLIWDHDKSPEVTALDLLNAKNVNYLLTERDFGILEAMLQYNYLTARQAKSLFEFSSRGAQDRLTTMQQIGLLDRAWGRYRKTPVPIRNGENLDSKLQSIGEWVYSLSSKGFEVLERSGFDLARAWSGSWVPRWHGESRKSSVAHELGRNDVCIAALKAAEHIGRPILEWHGPREAYQRVAPPTPGAPWQHIEPDSVLVLDTGRPLFIEYERSGRFNRIQKKIRDMRLYLASGAWKERYPLRPWIVYALLPGTGTQRVIAGSYGGLITQVKSGGAVRYLILDQTAWEHGTWEATNSDGKVVEFWKTVLAE